jgi:hypothetical protein
VTCFVNLIAPFVAYANNAALDASPKLNPRPTIRGPGCRSLSFNHEAAVAVRSTVAGVRAPPRPASPPVKRANADSAWPTT